MGSKLSKKAQQKKGAQSQNSANKEYKLPQHYQNYSYKVVNLQKLDRKEQPSSKKVQLQSLVNQLDTKNEDYYFAPKQVGKSNLTFEQKLYLYKDTAVNEKRIMGRFNNFFNAFYIPYNQHGDILLVPDDIWLMISLYLSKYIDKNAQKLRNHFVMHEGQKQLTIVEYANSLQQSLRMQKEWDYFFTQIIKQIQKNTKAGVVQQLSCNFSTTNDVYKLVSTSIIMSSFKQYFSYGRMILGCGLENIYFAGTRQDWIKVYQKLQKLGKYDLDGQLKKYISSVQVILKNFINTYDEKPDLKWWNTIMTTEQRRVGSGGQKDTYVEGWILHFYGIYDKVQVQKIPKSAISVPVKLVNKFTNIEKKLQLIADWVSVSKVDQFLYKPDIGVCLVERQRKNLQKN